VKLGFVAVLTIGMGVGAILSLIVQVFVFEPITKWDEDKRSAEMQIIVGGIGVSMIPLVIAEHKTKSNPFGFQASSFDVSTLQIGELRATNIAIISIAMAIV